MSPLLKNSKFDPKKEQILDNVNHFQEVLKIRRSSPLFRLQTKEEIKQRIKFHNMGKNQRDALIVMSIDDTVGENLDPNYQKIVALFNADKFGHKMTVSELSGKPMILHPIQANSHDEVVKSAKFESKTGEFQVPPRTAAVFVLPE
jgi:hypothetical protein